MNKFIKSILCLGVGGALLLSAGCSGCAKNQVNDPETRTLRLSTGALDKNFNPFFYTAQNDGNMIANTQIGMLNTDNNGKPVCGNNHPTVVLDYKETNIADASNSKGSRTEYEFVIKNGIEFSDGEKLTIADVLFNLYVYLDPVYTGSSTIYSTDIQGLKAYRAQDPELKDDDDKNSETGYVTTANNRINALISWSNGDTNTLTDDQKKDLKAVTDEFSKELESDWNNLSTSWKENYKDTYRFTSAWEAYLYEHGEVRDQRKRNENGSVTKYYEDKNNNGVREDGELYYTTLDNWQPGNSENGVTSVKGSQALIDMIAEATTDAEVNKYMSENKDVTDRDYAIEQLQKKACIKQVEATYINTEVDKSKIAEILTYWATASTIQEKFTNEARTKYFADLKEANNGAPLVPTVSGITTYTKSGSDLKNDFHGKMNETYVANETYSVLKIVINGVDPKAIYNFAFTVAPMHYYSGTYKGKNYVEEAKQGKGLGIEIGDSNFFDEVLKNPDKIGLPVGAGPYKAADFDGNPTDDKNKFVTSTIVSFVRNDKFTTVGTGIENAKIKKVQYKVLGDDDIMSNLIDESIDFGMPNATPTNKSDMSKNPSLEQQSYFTGGYGYVGINPKFVPEYKVRQALMMAMNTADALRYYGTDLAKYLYRPMTLTSWAYPKDAKEYYPFDVEQNQIKQLMSEAGYTIGSDGIYTKTANRGGMSNAALGTKMKLTFTIAGETTNHPAYLMFCNTRDRLNAIGFDITVKTDVSALKNLASGNLAIWGAAWSSALDPDPYQTYHKDSNASSVLNWNYKNILNDSQKWSYEYELIAGRRDANGNDVSISGLIDQGRATTEDNLRTAIYAQCLDLIMELAVELPTYQRNDMCVYNTKIIDASTLVQGPSYNMGLFDKLWEIDYV